VFKALIIFITQVQLDSRDCVDFQDSQVWLESQVPMENQEERVLVDLMDCLETPVGLVWLVNLEIAELLEELE